MGALPLRLLNKPLTSAGTSTKSKLLALAPHYFQTFYSPQQVAVFYMVLWSPPVWPRRGDAGQLWLQAALNSQTNSKLCSELAPSLYLATCLFGADDVALKNVLCHITQTQTSGANCGNGIIIPYEGAQIREEMFIFSKWLSNTTTLTGQLKKTFN